MTITTEQAIQSILDHIEVHGIGKYPHVIIAEALNMALAALQAQAEAEKNEPLTLEELREMGQRCEGIYVAYPDGAPVFREQTYCAAVLDFSPAFGSMKMHVHAIYGDRLTLWEDDYGKTWLAYRRKPEAVPADG